MRGKGKGNWGKRKEREGEVRGGKGREGEVRGEGGKGKR